MLECRGREKLVLMEDDVTKVDDAFVLWVPKAIGFVVDGVGCKAAEASSCSAAEVGS